jgi:Ser/Thr protein kinase RdoA (MazF antagonist)
LPQVDLATLSNDEIREVIARFGLELKTAEKMHNGAADFSLSFVPVIDLHCLGFSGCNYRCETSTGTFLLKGSTDLGLTEVRFQIQLLCHLQEHKFATAFPVSLAASPNTFDTSLLQGAKQMDLMLLNFLPGKPVNSLLGKDIDTAAGMLEVGRTLARLHLIPPFAEMRQYADGVGTKVGILTANETMRTHPETRVNQHSFLDWFDGRIDDFKGIFKHALPQGLMHCDPFLDNMLMLSDGRMSGSTRCSIIHEDIRTCEWQMFAHYDWLCMLQG